MIEIEIRTARPDDRGPIAQLMYSSGPDVYDYLLGDRALAFLRHEFASGRGFAGYANVTVALLDGEVVGTGCFYDRARYRKLLRGTAANYVSFFRSGAPALLWRSRHVRSIMRPPRPAELYLRRPGQLAQDGAGALASRCPTRFGSRWATGDPPTRPRTGRIGL